MDNLQLISPFSLLALKHKFLCAEFKVLQPLKYTECIQYMQQNMSLE